MNIQFLPSPMDFYFEGQPPGGAVSQETAWLAFFIQILRKI